MKKFVNLRLPVIVALSLCCGIGLGIALYFYNRSIAWAALAIVPAILIFLACWFKRKKIILPLVYILLPLLLFIGGALNSYYCLLRFDNSEIKESMSYAIHATVKEKGKTSSGEYIIVKNITLNGKRIGGNAYIYLAPTYGELCEEGYDVDFVGNLEKIQPFQYGELSHYAESNIKYRSSVFSGLQSTYGYSVFGSARTNMRDLLFSNLDENTAAISFAMLTGNTEQVDEASLESFRYGGVAHIFAVSGLHIGIIFALISFILKKLRANIYLSAVISLVTVFLYSALCGFTLSSLRAAIMCTVSTFANLFYKRYDGLNSLAIAVIIILSITPLSILSVGFQLSVCAVGGIYTMSKCVEKLCTKMRLHKKIASAVGVSVGAQLGTLPIMLSDFGYISGAGLLLNIVIIPVLSVTFVLIFLSVLLCSAIGIIAPFVLPYAALPLQFIISLFTGAGFENSLISGFGAGAFVPLYFLVILGASDKINLKVLTRIISLVCGSLILAAYVLIRYNAPFAGYQLIVSAYGDGGEAVIKSNRGAVLIVTEEINPSRLKSMLGRNYVIDVDALIILGENNLNVYPYLNLKCDNIYVCNTYPQIQPYGDIKINYSDTFSACGVEFSLLNNNSLIAEAAGVEIGICTGENHFVSSCDILISDNSEQTNYKTKVCFNNRANTLNVFDCGDIIFKIENGNFRLINEIPPER